MNFSQTRQIKSDFRYFEVYKICFRQIHENLFYGVVCPQIKTQISMQVQPFTFDLKLRWVR